MRVLVTGATGLLGSELVPRLEDHEVTAVGIEHGDILDPEWLRDCFDRSRPETVVHLAAWADVDGAESDPERAFRINAEGARRVAVEAENHGARILAVSTDYVFDGRETRPYREDDLPAPLGVYGRSKLAGEEAVREAATRWAVVRSAWLYGAGGANFVETILSRLRDRDHLDVVDDQIGSPTAAADLAAALVTLAERRARETIHVVNRGEVSWFTLAREAVRLSGEDPDRIRPVSTGTVGRPAPRPGYSALDPGHAESKYGIRMRPWNEALRDYLRSPGRVATGEAS